MADDVKMIRVGADRIGIIGLERVFEEVRAQGVQSDERLKDELLARVRKNNYIPAAAVNDYAEALVDEDIARFKDYGILGTPGLIINGVVKSAGKVPLKGEIAKWIEEASK